MKKLRYYKVHKGDRMNWREPISYDEALEYVSIYTGIEKAKKLLETPKRIKCMFSIIGVEEYETEATK